MRTVATLFIALSAALCVVNPGSAQATPPNGSATLPHTNVISANPFLLLWEWANAEYEHKVSPSGTVGVGGSWISSDGGDEDYIGINGFYRYYPQGTPFIGFYVGARGGFHQISDDNGESHAFGLGFDIGYSWLLGAERKFYIGLGIGATRLFGGDLEDNWVPVPSLRLVNIGIAF